MYECKNTRVGVPRVVTPVRENRAFCVRTPSLTSLDPVFLLSAKPWDHLPGE